MLEFYIIYSIDIPSIEEEIINELNDLSFTELFDELEKKGIELPCDIVTIEDVEEEDKEFYLENPEELENDYYGPYGDEMTRLLYDSIKDEKCNEMVGNNLNYYILRNPSLFTCTEEDNESDEYGLNYTMIHRKYTAILSKEQFVDFIEYLSPSSTENTMGSITELGWLPAFALTIENYNLDELTYVSVLFNQEIKEEKMIKIEEEIRELIDNYDLTLENLNKIMK